MKVIHSFGILVICCSMIDSNALGDQWSEERIGFINSLPENPTRDEIAMLSRLAGFKSHTQEESEVVKLSFERLTSIPDFDRELAQYLRDQKSKWKSGGGENAYNSCRYDIFDSLGRIPHPVTVRLLGDFLPDMEWTQDPIQHLMSGADYTITSPNGLLAACSLGELINEPPLHKKTGNYLEQDVLPWKAWYQEVKTGRKAFSFKGKNIEYRFNSDSTWTSTVIANPTKIDSRFPHHGAARENKSALATVDPVPVKQTTTFAPWPWIVGGVLVSGILALLIRGFKR